MLDLEAIRKKNAGQPDGYWKVTTAALCDEVERLQRLPVSSPDIDAIRRMDGHTPPWIVRMLCDRVEQAERDAASWRGQAVAWGHNITALTAERDQLRATVKELRT